MQDSRRHYPRRFPAERLPALFDGLVGAMRTVNVLDRAVFRRMLGVPEFATAKRIVEVGCGVGHAATRVLAVNPSCRYVGTEASPRMARATARRLASSKGRALAVRVAASAFQPLADGSADLLLSIYTVDLFAPAGVRTFLDEAHRILEPGGRLCLVTMWPAERPGLTQYLWETAYRIAPALTGGSRPMRVSSFVSDETWSGLEVLEVAAWGLRSGIVTAWRR